MGDELRTSIRMKAFIFVCLFLNVFMNVNARPPTNWLTEPPPRRPTTPPRRPTSPATTPTTIPTTPPTSTTPPRRPTTTTPRLITLEVIGDTYEDIYGHK